MPKGHLKNVFWPNIFVGASFPRVAGFPIWSYTSCGSQILDIQQYACGLKLGRAAILNQNPIFETAFKMGTKRNG